MDENSQEYRQLVSMNLKDTKNPDGKVIPGVFTDYLSAHSDLKKLLMGLEGAGIKKKYEYYEYKARVDAYKIRWKKSYPKLKHDVEVALGWAKAENKSKSPNVFVVNRGTFKKYCKEHGFDPAEIEKDDFVGMAITHILTYRPVNPETKKLMTVYDVLIRKGLSQHRVERYIRDSMKVNPKNAALAKAQKEAEKGASASLTGAFFD